MRLAKFLKNILKLLLSKQEKDSELQKLRDFKTVLAAIHLLFKIVINLENIRKFSGLRLAKLFDYKTVKCEVINVEFLIRDLPLSNYAIMVKLKCLKLLY